MRSSDILDSNMAPVTEKKEKEKTEKKEETKPKDETKKEEEPELVICHGSFGSVFFAA